LRRFRRLLAESHEFETVPLKSKLSDEEVAILAPTAIACRNRGEGAAVPQLSGRSRHGPRVGFIGRINDRDLKSLRAAGREQNYKGSVHIGKTGLEQSYEALLHGRTGFEQMETDASGRACACCRGSRRTRKDLRLHLDLGCRRWPNTHSAIISVDWWRWTPKRRGTALVSKPGFDPNLFVDGVDPDTWRNSTSRPNARW